MQRMTDSADASQPFQHSPDGWPLVRRLIENVTGFFGDPSTLYFANLRPRAAYNRFKLKQTLNLMLALVRRLILIESLAIVLKPGTLRGPRPRKQKLPIVTFVVQSEPCVAFFTNKPRMKEDSKHWRVSLHLFPSPQKKREKPPRKSIWSKPLQFTVTERSNRNALREMALRFEALRRVANNPARYARRVARLRLKRPPLWLLEEIKPRRLGDHAYLIKPAHRVAMQMVLDSS